VKSRIIPKRNADFIPAPRRIQMRTAAVCDARLAPNYLTRMTHSTIEDEYIERMLEGRFSGAGEMRTRAYVNGVRAVAEGRPVRLAGLWRFFDDGKVD
jgi:hypothetical protein